MIGRLQGLVVDRDPAHGGCVLDVGGVGYEVFVPLRSLHTLPTPPARVTLHIHTHVREEALTLYGFQSTGDRMLFRALIGVSGVGPKLAMAVLSDMTGDELCAAVAQGHKARLSAVAGVGAKLAARLILELRDKIPAPAPFAAGPSAPDRPSPMPAVVPNTAAGEVTHALVTLGFARAQAEAAVALIVAEDDERPVEVLLRLTLASMAGR